MEHYLRMVLHSAQEPLHNLRCSLLSGTIEAVMLAEKESTPSDSRHISYREKSRTPDTVATFTLVTPSPTPHHIAGKFMSKL